MIHLINEGGNSELKNRVFPLAKGIKKHLIQTLNNYKGDKTIEGYKRLNNLLSMQNGISYSEMKRLKNFFDNYQGSDQSMEFILNGGEPMKLWVNNTLYTATKAIKDFKQAKSDAGVKNAFRKSHEKDRQNKRKNKPTQVRFKTNDVNKGIKNNTLLKFESVGVIENKKKIICITENQQKYFLKHLNEAQNDNFSLEELSNLPSFNQRYQYCIQNIGKPQGRGSSRVCFQLTDDKILKLAYNNKGVAQNNQEYDGYLDDLGIVPHTYDIDRNGLWVVSEYVLPAKKNDFKHCLNMSFEEFCEFIKACHMWRFNHKQAKMLSEDGELMTLDSYTSIIDNNEDLASFDDYIGNYNPPIGDLTVIRNYGMTMRYGVPTIVILDTGLSEEIWNIYYKK